MAPGVYLFAISTSEPAGFVFGRRLSWRYVDVLFFALATNDEYFLFEFFFPGHAACTKYCTTTACKTPIDVMHQMPAQSVAAPEITGSLEVNESPRVLITLLPATAFFSLYPPLHCVATTSFVAQQSVVGASGSPSGRYSLGKRGCGMGCALEVLARSVMRHTSMGNGGAYTRPWYAATDLHCSARRIEPGTSTMDCPGGGGLQLSHSELVDRSVAGPCHGSLELGSPSVPGSTNTSSR